MLRRWSYERWIMAALGAFGVLIFAASFGIDGSTASPIDVGPAFVPRVFSAALVLCALWAIVAKPRESENAPLDRMVFVTMALLVAYAIALPIFGYVLSTLLVLCILLWAVRAGAWWRIATFAIGMTALSYLIFERLLTIGLPAGPWGF